MVRKLGLTIAYFLAVVYILSFLAPLLYCLPNCDGPVLDAFLPAAALTPFGAVGTAFSLRNSIQNIRKRQPSSWLFWPLAVIFSIVLAGVITLFALVVYLDVTGNFAFLHRSVRH
jgi:hypothetical protein